MAVDLRSKILAATGDQARDLAYYDRKEDEELPRGEIGKAIRDGVITFEEITDHFAAELWDWLEDEINGS